MKKSITGAVTLLAGAVMVHAQGQVSFANYYSSGNYVHVEYNGANVGGSATHTGTSADTAVGSDWSVQLYGAPGTGDALSTLVPAVLDGTASTPVTATLAGVGPAGASFLGEWNSGAIGDITGAAVGTSATVAVAAWYNNNGTVASITAAQAAGFANGWSATGNVVTGGAPNLPAALPALGNINTVGQVGTVPEPSTIALGVMGASAFLMRLRKKQ